MTARVLNRRDVRIAAATKALDRAYGLIVEAMAFDEQAHPIDKVGALALAQAADDCTRAMRRMEYGQQHARQSRRDTDRQMAAERATNASTRPT